MNNWFIIQYDPDPCVRTYNSKGVLKEYAIELGHKLVKAGELYYPFFIAKCGEKCAIDHVDFVNAIDDLRMMWEEDYGIDYIFDLTKDQKEDLQKQLSESLKQWAIKNDVTHTCRAFYDDFEEIKGWTE